MNNSILLVLFAIASVAASTTLPDEFYGKFDLDHSENFDEYLVAKGYSWFTRMLIKFAKFQKVFHKASGGKFNFDNLTSKKNIHYRGVVLDKEFRGEGLDSHPHKIEPPLNVLPANNRRIDSRSVLLFSPIIFRAVVYEQRETAAGNELESKECFVSRFEVTFSMRGGHLFEKLVPVEQNDEAKDQEYEYYFEGSFLVVRMEADNVVAKLYYKRLQ